ncbi:MAG: hypothetical protein JWO82_2183 [Akkermansiaceae bacterium]|nr:hypothetical protein [Akkermansiaceae bacterium]
MIGEQCIKVYHTNCHDGGAAFQRRRRGREDRPETGQKPRLGRGDEAGSANRVRRPETTFPPAPRGFCSVSGRSESLAEKSRRSGKLKRKDAKDTKF